MATQQSEAPVAPESQDVLLALNKQNKEYGYVTELNPQTGDFTWETPEGNDYRERMFRFPTNTWLGQFFEQFRRQYGNPSRIGFDFFRVPVDMADRVLSALVKVRIEESGTRADQKLLDDYRLNDEGRNARQAETYSFEERELTDSLTELGLTPGQLRDAHEMGNLMKGYITSTPLPIYKEINGERKPLGEACFYAVREEGRTIVKALPVLKSPQYDMTAYKELFTDRQRKQLAANGHLEGTKVMRDFTTGRECECYVSYHEPTRRLTTLPVDSLRPLTHIYGQPLSRQEQEALRGGRQVEVIDIQRRDGRLISGILRADANHRGFYFKDTETTLRIGERVNGALIDDTQRAKLENHELVYVTGMRRRNGTTYSDDVIFTEGNIQLVGQAARNYKPQQAQRQIRPRPRTARSARTEASLPQPKRPGLRNSGLK